MPCLNGGTCAVASNMPDGFICRCPPVSATVPTEFHIACDRAETKPGISELGGELSWWGRFLMLASLGESASVFLLKLLKYFGKQ